MPKRNATSELNHDNWNDDDVPEEAGTYQKASPEVIGKRVIKSARRRGLANNSPGSSVFANFQGFSKTPDTNNSLFSFLKKDDAQPGGLAGGGSSSGGAQPQETPVASTECEAESFLHPPPPYTPLYLAAIKKLNECFMKHLQLCYKENELIIFSPCFEDYENHLKDLLPLNNPSTSNVQDNLNCTTQLKSFVSQADNVESSGKLNILRSQFSKQNSESKSISEEKESPLPSSSGASPKLSFKATGAPQTTWLGKVGESTVSNFMSSSVEDTKKQTSTAEDPSEENDEEPAKVEFKAVVEEGAVYSRRCKVFFKKDNSYQDHGVGMLYLKPVEGGKKTQLIVRADTSIGNVLINTLLNADMSMQKMGTNNVMLCCVPTPDFNPPKPLPVLLRVKTSDDADELLKKMNELIKP